MIKTDKIMKWGSDLQQSVLSLVKVALLSKKQSPLPDISGNKDELVILANGPSLNRTVEKHRQWLEGKSLLAVNFAATSPMFTQLRPQLYLIADPLFWIVDQKRDLLFGALADKTAWPLDLFIPVRARSSKKWQPLIQSNPNIRLHFYNTTPVEGYKRLTHSLYEKGLGVPRPHNVLIPSIAMALRLPFKKIYLAGADHSWLPEISVTDDNVVLMHQKHFYDTKSSRAETVKQENLTSAPLHQILYHMHVAFKAYFTLREYAFRLGKEVINITPGSYIDAFRRQKLAEEAGPETEVEEADKEPTPQAATQPLWHGEATDGIVIQARSGSTRMPAKILRPFDGERRIIDIIIENIKRSCPGCTIVLATTTNEADNALEEVARQHGINCYRGSEDDVLQRFVGAADRFGLKRMIRVCSDNPFLQTDTFPALFEAHDQTPDADYVAYGFPDGRPTIKSHLGLYAELCRADALRRVAATTADKMTHEHVTIYLYSHPEQFKVKLLELPEFLKNRLDLRLTLDTPSDFALLSELYHLFTTQTDGSLQALISLVDSNPRYGAIMKQNIAENEK